jgi:hypothetical protein
MAAGDEGRRRGRTCALAVEPKDLATVDTSESCGCCRFAEFADGTTPWGRPMSCRRYPPSQLMFDGQPRMFWPVLLESGWCGEFQRGTPHLGRGDTWRPKAEIAKDNIKREPVQ